MPKERKTCTRCSQRRQKCDRKSPCTRCVRNKESHLCTTQWSEGYNPVLHRKYPRRPSPALESVTSSNDTSSTYVSPSGLVTEQHKQAGAVSTSHRSPAETQKGFNIGQREFIDITIGSLLNDKDTQPAQDLFGRAYRDHLIAPGSAYQTSGNACCLSSASQASEMQYIQSLLPPKDAVLNLVDYYNDCMLYWINGMYHGPGFRKKLVDAYGSSSFLDLQSLDWRWTALLFAILTSGIIASPEATSLRWGFPINDKVRLAREWGDASVVCLNLGCYMSKYHIYSIQAINILHTYEHLVGSATQWAALRAVSVIIAKGLGLHRLGPHPEDQNVAALDERQKEAFVEREIGRRAWAMVVIQEWLCASSVTEWAATIQKRDFTTLRPMILDDNTMLPLKNIAPSFTLVGAYFYDFATLLLEYNNAMGDNIDADDTVKYALVLKFDGEMRAIYAEKLPKFLTPHTNLQSSWPKWVKWARTLHEASHNHKIIMIHQGFLSKSFKDKRYTYTRWATRKGARNIIELYKTRDPDEPQFWVEQAFVVTAGICLILDLLHRPKNDKNVEEDLACINRAIRYLQSYNLSTIAVHGARLLQSLLQECNKVHGGERLPQAPPKPVSDIHMVSDDMEPVDLPRVPPDPTMFANSELSLPLMDETGPYNFNFDIDMTTFEGLMDNLPLEARLDNNVFLDSIFGLSSGFPNGLSNEQYQRVI